jgi:SNF2 family DNA or RNA helicase
MHVLNQDQFDDHVAFADSFSCSALGDEERVAELHNTFRPLIIRRQRYMSIKLLPKKTCNVLRVGMTSSQQLGYRWFLTKNFANLNAGTSGKGMGPKTTLQNLIMKLTKCCIVHFPFGNVEDITVKTTVETLIRASGKMILLDKRLLRLREKGHRVLVFSQMMRMVDILSDYCRMRGFPFQRLDGPYRNDLRERVADRYNAPESTDYVFLLPTRAGGLSINLATSDTVSYFTQTGIRRTIFGWNLVRMASDKQRTLIYLDYIAEKLLKISLNLNGRRGNACSNFLCSSRGRG